MGTNTLHDAGIRLKGHGSFRPLDDRPNLTIKFNQFTAGQKLYGLTTVLLNNASDANITVANLSVTSDTSATADLTISSTAALGARVVQMTTPGGSSTAAGTDGTLFTVQ